MVLAYPQGPSSPNAKDVHKSPHTIPMTRPGSAWSKLSNVKTAISYLLSLFSGGWNQHESVSF